MAGRTSHQAVIAFQEPLNKAIARVTSAQLDVAGGFSPADNPHTMTLNRGRAARLYGDAGVHLYVTMHYEIVKAERPLGPWKVKTLRYYYHLLTSEAGGEVLLFHWHPGPPSDYEEPHVHVGDEVRRDDMLAKAHVPTGRIALEDVLLFAIRELGVEPRPSREYAIKVIEASRERFKQCRTWP